MTVKTTARNSTKVSPKTQVKESSAQPSGSIDEIVEEPKPAVSDKKAKLEAEFTEFKTTLQDHLTTLNCLGYKEMEYEDIPRLLAEKTPLLAQSIEAFARIAEGYNIGKITFYRKVYDEAERLSSIDTFFEHIYPQKTAWEHKISGKTLDSKEIEYAIRNWGIFQLDVPFDQKKRPTEQPLWRWDSFEIHRVLVQDNPHKEFYDFEWNGHEFRDMDMKAMREMMAEHCMIQGKSWSYFGPLVSAYIKGQKIPQAIYSPICGFTKDGWCFPGDGTHWIKFTTGIQEKERENIESMMKLKPEETKAREFMQLLRDNINIEYRDIFLARGIVMPFLHSLKEHTHLSPWFSAGSVKGGTGKTTMMELITKRFWNFPFILSKDNVNSDSRFQKYITFSTLGIVIDDCSNLDIKMKNDIKTYLTQESRDQKQDIDQTLKIDKERVAPLNLTFNEAPEMYDDSAFLQRGLHVELTRKMSEPDKAKFEKIANTIPAGYIGRYIYSISREWTLQDLLKRYNALPSLAGNNDIRANTIFKIWMLGAELMQEWFGITLDMTSLPALIQKTITMGSEAIFSIVQRQCEQGILGKNESGRDSWIKASIEKRENDFGQLIGYFYFTENLADLNNLLKINIKGLPALADMLNKQWPNAEYKQHKVKGKNYKAIYIPISDLEKVEPESDQEGGVREQISPFGAYTSSPENANLALTFDNIRSFVLKTIGQWECNKEFVRTEARKHYGKGCEALVNLVLGKMESDREFALKDTILVPIQEDKTIVKSNQGNLG